MLGTMDNQKVEGAKDLGRDGQLDVELYSKRGASEQHNHTY